MECPHELWMRLEPVDGVCPHCSFEENVRLRASLQEMINATCIFHGPVAWDIYYENAPEMKRAKALLGL